MQAKALLRSIVYFQIGFYVSKRKKMLKTRSLFVVVILSLFSSFAFPETAGEIIKRAIENSVKVQENIKYVKINSSSVMEMQGRKMTVNSTISQKDKKIRIDASSSLPGTKEEMESVMIYDGKTTWMITPMSGKQQTEGKAIGLNTITEEEEWWTKVGSDIELKGEEKIGGIDCFILEAKNAAEAGKFWIGKNNLALVKATGEDAQNGKFEVISSEFKDVGFGWTMAYKTEMKTDKGVTMSNSVKSIDVNKGLKDDIFAAADIDISKLKMPKLEGGNGLEP